MNGIKSQQFRWMKGGAENARLLSPMVLRSDFPLSTKLHALAYLFNSSIFVAVLMLALTSVALLPFFDRLAVDTRVLSISLLGLVGVAAVYFYANVRLLPRPLALRQVLALILYFPVLLTMFLGLSFHNTVAVIEGFLGIKSSFVRTPKYNIVGRIRTTVDEAQKIPISKSLLIEGLLALLFAAALVMGVVVQNYAFLVFHLMLAVGFGTVFVVSWRER